MNDRTYYLTRIKADIEELITYLPLISSVNWLVGKHQEIPVGVGPGVATGAGAKQPNLSLWVKLLDGLLHAIQESTFGHGERNLATYLYLI